MAAAKGLRDHAKMATGCHDHRHGSVLEQFDDREVHRITTEKWRQYVGQWHLWGWIRWWRCRKAKQVTLGVSS